VLGTSDAIADHDAIQKVRAAIAGHVEVRVYSSYQAFLVEMQGAQVVISGRMHACVMAMCAGVPVVCPVYGDGDIRMTEVFNGGPATPIYAGNSWLDRISLEPQVGQRGYCREKAASAQVNADVIRRLVS
jgi:hypothetical protein